MSKKKIDEYIPQEPSIEEQIKMDTAELERRNQDLTINIINKENEINLLKDEIEYLKSYYKNIIAQIVIDNYNNKN